MLELIKKYKYSFLFALTFHVVLFSFILINWQPEAKTSKKIVIKKGDVIKATAINPQHYEQQVKNLELVM